MMTTSRARMAAVSGGRAILAVACLVAAALYILYLTTAPMSNRAGENSSAGVLKDVRRRALYSNDELMDLRLNWIYPPGPGYKKRVDESQHGQSKFVDDLLKQRENGFFVECGAHSGMWLSNSIFFETQRKWTGLLVEPQRFNFEELLRLRRKAYAINACMSPTTQSGLFAWGLVDSTAALYDSHIHKHVLRTPAGLKQCFSFGAMMAALNVTRVDYFSLDVEGSEVPLLKTIPWHDVYIDVIGAEYRYVLAVFFCVSLCARGHQ